MPTSVWPAAKPVTARLEDMLPGAPLSNRTKRFPAVRPTTAAPCRVPVPSATASKTASEIPELDFMLVTSLLLF